MKSCKLLFFYAFILFFSGILSANSTAMSLRNNLQRANPGDFIVASQNKNYTLIHVFAKQNNTLVIEEITIPAARLSCVNSWRKWVLDGAPCNTSWILTSINLPTGEIRNAFSVSQRAWLDVAQKSNFLPTLLNLHLVRLSESERRKIGPPPGHGPDRRSIWQPKMVIEGNTIPGVAFSAWRTRWPQDNTPLSGKLIEVYVPEESDKYPSYFPYWLQIRGAAGAKATVYIIDSGSNLTSPAVLPPEMR